MNYYNTTKIHGTNLLEAIAKAVTQEDKIIAFFKLQEHTCPDSSLTPFDVLDAVFSTSTPITSVRRAMTNLTTAGKLIKTDIQRAGRYGMVCHTWKLKK